MITKKVFFKAVAAILVLALLFGAVLPYLMSAKSTIAVAIALTTLVIMAVGGVYYVLFSNKKVN